MKGGDESAEGFAGGVSIEIVFARKATPAWSGSRKRRSSGRSQAQKVTFGNKAARSFAGVNGVSPGLEWKTRRASPRAGRG